MQGAFAFRRQQRVHPVERREVRRVVNGLLDARQGQLAIRPEQGESVQRLRQGQQVTFIAVAEQLVRRIIQLKVVLLRSRCHPFGQMRLFRRLTGNLHRVGCELGEPRRIFLRFGELVAAHNQQQIAVKQADQRGQLFIDGRVRAVFRQQDLNSLARRKKAHRLTE